MRKISFTLLTMVMIATTMAFAQNNMTISPKGFPGTAKEISVQDDQGKGYIVINTITGDYKVVFCEYGYTFSGTGKVEVLGCNVYFSDIQDGYRMFASVSMCKQQGKASCEVFEGPDMPKIDPISELWSDANLKDNTTRCWKMPW